MTNITHDSIAERAYKIWERNGCPEGTQDQDWLQAAEELASEAMDAAEAAANSDPDTLTMTATS